jgi:peptidoglycan L-alanyl-D-glutamate endopeptidase CwlK
MSKPWWLTALEALASALAGKVTEDRLHELGVSPGATILTGGTVDLPTLSGPVGAPPGLDDSRDLADCHPELQRRYLALKADFEAETGRQLFLTQTYRSPKRQQELYAQGRTTPGQIVTNLDGLHKKSRHNVWPSQAVDVCVDTDPGPGKHPVWDHGAYAPLGPLAAKHGLIWGGGWVSLHDDPHLELPAVAA